MASPDAQSTGSEDLERFVVRRKFFTFLGQKFYINDDNGALIGFVKQKAFKLREDIRVYTDEECAKELLVIKARNILDFSAAFDVVDAVSQEKVGVFRRKGFTSTLVRDEWEVLDPQDNPVGTIQEDSVTLGLIRRYIFKLLPQSFTVAMGEKEVAEFRQNWNIFMPRMACEYRVPAAEFDRRLGIAAAVLISTIEGRKQ